MLSLSFPAGYVLSHAGRMQVPHFATSNDLNGAMGYLQEDVILKVTSTAICGSDLHLYLNAMPGMKAGDILGHEVCFLTVLKHGLAAFLQQQHVVSTRNACNLEEMLMVSSSCKSGCF